MTSEGESAVSHVLFYTTRGQLKDVYKFIEYANGKFGSQKNGVPLMPLWDLSQMAEAVAEYIAFVESSNAE